MNLIGWRYGGLNEKFATTASTRKAPGGAVMREHRGSCEVAGDRERRGVGRFPGSGSDREGSRLLRRPAIVAEGQNATAVAISRVQKGPVRVVLTRGSVLQAGLYIVVSVTLTVYRAGMLGPTRTTKS